MSKCQKNYVIGSRSWLQKKKFPGAASEQDGSETLVKNIYVLVPAGDVWLASPRSRVKLEEAVLQGIIQLHDGSLKK